MSHLKVTKVTIVQRAGTTDLISLHLSARTPFPECGYEAVATVNARKGYGPEWVRAELGIEPEIITDGREKE